jgi:hypothetical protein
MRRAGTLAVVIVLLAHVGLAACTGSRPNTRLRVEIAGLPAEVAAQVGVAGPDGTSYTITTNDERRVPPGVYTVTIEAVRDQETTFYPADDQYQVAVEPEQTTRTTAAYRVAVPDTTEILDPADTTIVEVRDTEIVFSAGSAQAAALQPGDHLISGEGERVPHMLVRRVTSVSSSDNQIVVETEPATFDEALPAGVIRFDTVDGLTIMRPASYTTSAQSDPLAQVDFSLKYQGGACSAAEDAPRSTSVAGSVSYRLEDIDLDVDGEFSWDGILNPSVSVSAGATLSLDQSVEAEIEAAVRCEVEAEHEVRLGCGSVLGQIVRVGPVRLGCRFKIVGKAFVETKATWNTGTVEARTTLGFEAGYDSHDGGFHADPTLDTDLTSQAPTAPEYESSFGASLGFQVGLEGKDPTGIARLNIGLEVTAGPRVTSEPTEFRGDFEATPKLVAEAKLGAGFLEWKGDAEITLPGVEINLWRTSSSAPPSSDGIPTATLPPTTPGDIPEHFIGTWIGNTGFLEIRADGVAEIHSDLTYEYQQYQEELVGDGQVWVILDVELRSDADGLAGTIVGRRTELHTDGRIDLLDGPYSQPDIPIRIEYVPDKDRVEVQAEDPRSSGLVPGVGRANPHPYCHDGTQLPCV